jgi:hypothetical protein
MTDTGKRGGKWVAVRGKVLVTLLLWFLRLATPDLECRWGNVGVGTKSASGGENPLN